MECTRKKRGIVSETDNGMQWKFSVQTTSLSLHYRTYCVTLSKTSFYIHCLFNHTTCLLLAATYDAGEGVFLVWRAGQTITTVNFDGEEIVAASPTSIVI